MTASTLVDDATVNGLRSEGDVIVSGTLTVSDNIGIGTTTPAAKLDVNGDIRWTGRLQNMVVSGYSVRQDDAAGSNSVTMVPFLRENIYRSICFLTRTRFEDIDTEDEWAECHVGLDYRNDWVLTAEIGDAGGPDANVYCVAWCLQW
jgi:hypothetical protein